MSMHQQRSDTPALLARMEEFGNKLEAFCERIGDELVFERAELTSECSSVRDAYKPLLEDARRRAARAGDAGLSR